MFICSLCYKVGKKKAKISSKKFKPICVENFKNEIIIFDRPTNPPPEPRVKQTFF